MKGDTLDRLIAESPAQKMREWLTEIELTTGITREDMGITDDESILVQAEKAKAYLSCKREFLVMLKNI